MAWAAGSVKETQAGDSKALGISKEGTRLGKGEHSDECSTSSWTDTDLGFVVCQRECG